MDHSQQLAMQETSPNEAPARNAEDGPESRSVPRRRGRIAKACSQCHTRKQKVLGPLSPFFFI
jgi:cytochrome c553